MNQKSLIGIVVGLMIATSVVYFVETIEEFEEGDMIKGPFFLVVAVAYIPVTYWMLSKDSSVPFVVAIAGTIGIMILYAVTRADIAAVFGMEAGRIGQLGIISKVLQVGVVTGSLLVLLQAKKDRWLKHKEDSFVN
jgi:predicted transcriptional regulator